MSHEVYADGMEIAAKSGMGKVIAAFPDVCMSPPAPPAGPIPLPYPDTSMSTDVKEGSDTVKLSGKPAALAQQSYYQPSALGDEAATKAWGMSVVTHQITGKTFFQAWSMDVLIEGRNVCRHLDITTSNHASYPGSTPPFPNQEAMVRLAQARIAAKQCPCCGKSDCVAAFKDGETAQSMEDFYGFNQTQNGVLTEEATARFEVYKRLLAIKERHCTCEGRVFPQAPCDVFRARDPNRTEKIEDKWREASLAYYTDFTTTNPDAISNFVAANPGETAPSIGPTFGQVNHLTPKGAGGCPDNPGNLQPHDTLCKACKLIDDQFGHWQGDNKQWRSQWDAAFRKSGIKRRTIANFTPNHW
jgi:hypothetical protein